MAKSDLQAARERAGLKLAEAAKKLGMSATVLRMLEDSIFRPTAEETASFGRLYARASRSSRASVSPGQGDLFEGDL